MNLLLTNDDGIASPFLRLLAEEATQRGHRVTICAPATQQSTTSHHYHTHADILAQPREFPHADAAWALHGTPVDCVRIGLRELCPGADAVFSGINLGYNTGWPIYASGTVGAAREAVLTGLTGFAVSAEPATPQDTLHHFAAWSLAFAERIHATPDAPRGVWNLNAPCIPLSALRVPVAAPLHRGIYRDAYTRTPTAEGLLFRQRGLAQPDPDPGSDQALLAEGHITCTLLPPDPAPCDGLHNFFHDL